MQPLSEFPNYLIDEHGGIYSLITHQFLRHQKGRNYKGKNNMVYWTVGLKKGNKIYSQYVHRLLAQTFIPNPDQKSTVNHKDGNRLNNSLSNLEWSTQKENIQHALNVLQTFKANRKLKDTDIPKIFNQRKNGATLPQIANFFDVNIECIRKVLNGISWVCVSKPLNLI